MIAISLIFYFLWQNISMYLHWITPQSSNIITNIYNLRITGLNFLVEIAFREQASVFFPPFLDQFKKFHASHEFNNYPFFTCVWYLPYVWIWIFWNEIIHCYFSSHWIAKRTPNIQQKKTFQIFFISFDLWHFWV